MSLVLGTKAETLERLAQELTGAIVLPRFWFGAAEWNAAPEDVIGRFRALEWSTAPLIVRSSARNEDGFEASQAGRYLSVPDVQGEASLREAVSCVLASYGEGSPGDQVLVQPCLAGVRLAGVAFSVDPSTGAPYAVVAYHEGGSTAAVTSGTASGVKTLYHFHGAEAPPPAPLDRVLALLAETERLTGVAELDIEFALDSADRLVLLQARRLHGVPSRSVGIDEQQRALAEIERRVAQLATPHPYLRGRRGVFGVMPDWNPAEIIGVRPRPLALTLYREVITDSIWAYQRDNYGYQNLRSFPLLVSYAGVPYVDVRVSFNSFIPKDVPDDLADRLVDHYVERLCENPGLHDKVEFDIVYSCYTLDLPERIQALRAAAFDEVDCSRLCESLRTLTNRIIHGERGLWRDDVAKIEQLGARIDRVLGSGLDKVACIYWLLEDCKRYGTLPFAGLARAGFIAVQLLRSLVAVGILSQRDYGAFMGSLDSVSSRMSRDLRQLSRAQFLERYGHLRPGTYDVLSPRYDEDPERYFDWSALAPEPEQPAKFSLSLEQMRTIDRELRRHALEHDVLGLFEFMSAAIEGREHAKFVFSRALSQAMSLLVELGAEHGLSRDDVSYLDVAVVRNLYGSSASVATLLADSVRDGRRAHALTRQVVLPPLIEHPRDVWSFHVPAGDPNFVTQLKAAGPVRTTLDDKAGLAGAIVFVPSADPGFDWLFAHGIAAFVTMYGGANSHMAIRAGELRIPAVIGAGETLYRRWATAAFLEVDCENRQVRRLR